MDGHFFPSYSLNSYRLETTNAQCMEEKNGKQDRSRRELVSPSSANKKKFRKEVSLIYDVRLKMLPDDFSYTFPSFRQVAFFYTAALLHPALSLSFLPLKDPLIVQILSFSFFFCIESL
jgi:hypothetical protein